MEEWEEEDLMEIEECFAEQCEEWKNIRKIPLTFIINKNKGKLENANYGALPRRKKCL